MKNGTYEYQTDFVRQYARRLQEARQEGKQEGPCQGVQRALLRILAARGLEVDPSSQRRIGACMDLEQLERWLDKALTVSSVQQLFEPSPG